jgi:hypothetical protein
MILFQLDAGRALLRKGAPPERELVNREIVEQYAALGLDLVNPTPGDLQELALLGETAAAAAPWSAPLWQWREIRRSGAAISVLPLGLVHEAALERWRDRPPRPRGTPSPESLVHLALAALDGVAPEELLPYIGDVDLLLVTQKTVYRRAPVRKGPVTIVHVPAEGQHLGVIELAADKAPGGPLRITERWLSLHEPKPVDPLVQRSIERLNRRLHEVQRALAEGKPSPTAATDFVGAAACGKCHERELRIWRTTAHARALETLRERLKEYDRTCLPCHVTAWQDGFVDAESTPELGGVQCEACHGPGRAHAEHGAPPPAPPESGCRSCHTPERSPSFSEQTYRPRIAHW